MTWAKLETLLMYRQKFPVLPDYNNDWDLAWRHLLFMYKQKIPDLSPYINDWTYRQKVPLRQWPELKLETLLMHSQKIPVLWDYINDWCVPWRHCVYKTESPRVENPSLVRLHQWLVLSLETLLMNRQKILEFYQTTSMTGAYLGDIVYTRQKVPE